MRMKMLGATRRSGGLFASASLAALATAMLATAPANALIPRDDVGAAGAVDVDNVWAGVGQMFNLQPAPYVGLCTGSLVNPRAIMFAAHCVDNAADESYGALTGGIGISFGFNVENDFPGDLQQWIGAGYASQPDINLYNVLQVQTILNAPPGNFPLGDVAMGSFSDPVSNLPTYGMLFSPLEGPTHGALVGYGRTGDGSTGDSIGIDFKRRAGENMIDGLFTQNDYIAGVFNVPGASFEDPSAEMLLYHVDMDRPDRTPGDCVRGEFFGLGFGNDIVCFTGATTDPLTWDLTSAITVNDQIDWFPGDALPNEAATAGGDSGGPLFADEIYERPLITGVLSGGWVSGFFDPNGGYGSESYYTPLFLFRDWIQTNNPYVYASARHGSRNWSNPNHWVQDMDPNYFYIDAHGNVRNGVPSDPEPTADADGPKFGTVFDLIIPDDVEGDNGAPGPLDPPAAASASIDVGSLTTDFTASVAAPAHWNHHWSGNPTTPSPAASDGAPTGPGSTGFVPNNDWGTFGSWTGPVDGVARFYDVTLDNIGSTHLDMNVEIDRLTVDGYLSRLNVRDGFQLNSLIAVDQNRGRVDVDGAIATREYMLAGGFLTGDGSITADTVWNVNGLISAGGLSSVGEMTINGDYVQTSAGDMLINISRHRRHTHSDHIQVNGDASLAGRAIVSPVNPQSQPRWRDVYTVLSADNVVGNFDDVDLIFANPTLYGESVVTTDGDVEIHIEARRLGHIFGRGHHFHSLGSLLDRLRWGGHFTDVEDVFTLIDSQSFESFDAAMFSLTPQMAFQQANTVFSFQNSFNGHLAARSAELRAGVRGVSSNGLRGAFASRDRATGSAAFRTEAGAPTPNMLGERFGIFVSSRGSFEDAPMGAETGFDYDPHAGLTESQGDLAVGADYRVSDNFAVGMALTTSRMDFSTNGITPISNESVGAAAYATAYADGAYIDGYYGFARQDFEMERLATPSLGNPSVAYGAPEGDQIMAGLRSGWSFSPSENFAIGPTASLNYTQLRLGAYEEAMGGDFSLMIDERELTSVSLEAGAEFRFTHETSSGGRFSAFGDFAFVRELGDSADTVTAAFAAVPGQRFSIEQLLDDDWVSASAGVSYSFSDNFRTSFEVMSDFDRGPLNSHYATVGFDWRF